MKYSTYTVSLVHAFSCTPCITMCPCMHYYFSAHECSTGVWTDLSEGKEMPANFTANTIGRKITSPGVHWCVWSAARVLGPVINSNACLLCCRIPFLLVLFDCVPFMFHQLLRTDTHVKLHVGQDWPLKVYSFLNTWQCNVLLYGYNVRHHVVL